MAAATRHVAIELDAGDRGCLYCLSSDGPFDACEHVLPARFGPDADRYVLEPGIVCDPCNHFLGKQVDAPFTDRFDLTLTRGLEGLRDRRGRTVQPIYARNPTAQLDVRINGTTVRIYATRTVTTPEGGLDIEIDPVRRDPLDIVARTVRALWKIALGSLCLRDGLQAALDPKWDYLRRAILGAPFRGFLLQGPFRVQVTRSLSIDIESRVPAHPAAIRFSMGGVHLAAPLHDGASVTVADVQAAGWAVLKTDDPPQRLIRLRLEPD